MVIIICSSCKKEEENYSKGMCKKCYNHFYSKKYYKDNKQKFLDAANKKYKDHRDECLKNMKKYAIKNKNTLKEYYKDYYLKNKKRMKKDMKKYYNTVLKCTAKEQYQKRKERVKGDKLFKLKENLRSRIGMAIKHQRTNKASKSLKLLGADINSVRQHIESQFKDNMSWENHGEWHIDHIVPCSKFDLIDKEQQKKCFHYTNLQPLWAKENLSKGGN